MHKLKKDESKETHSLSLVVCCSALNYVYATLSGIIGNHNVVCLNQEIADWIEVHPHDGLREIFVCDFRKLSLRENLNFIEFYRQKKIIKKDYEQVFLSFSSGWHFVWLDRILSFSTKNLVLVDDGLGNITELRTKFYLLRKLISLVVFWKSSGFSKYRNFHVKFVKKIVTIYDLDLYEKPYSDDVHVINIADKLSDYIRKNTLKNKKNCQSYGVYLQSERGNYNNDHTAIVTQLLENIHHLQEKTSLNWFVKVKASDPLKQKYLSAGLNLIESSINQELLMNNQITDICCRHDTFLLNALILNIPVKIYLRKDEKSKINYDEKIKVINKQLNKSSRAVDEIDL